jgi:exosome complex RNA-binding protein Rrp4
MPAKQGVVIYVNRRRSIGIVQVAGAGYAVVDWTSGKEPRTNDLIVGSLDRCGWTSMRDQTTGEDFTAYVHIVDCSMETALGYIG